VISAGGIADSRQAAYGLTGYTRSADHDIGKPEERGRHGAGAKARLRRHIPSGLARAVRYQNALLVPQNPPKCLAGAPWSSH